MNTTLRPLLLPLLAALVQAGVAVPRASACGGYTDERPTRVRIEAAAFHHFDNAGDGVSVSDIQVLSPETAPRVTVAVGMWVIGAQGRRTRTEQRLTLVNHRWAFEPEGPAAVHRAPDRLRFGVWQHLRATQSTSRIPAFELRDVTIERSPTYRATTTLVVHPGGASETPRTLALVPAAHGWAVSPS